MDLFREFLQRIWPEHLDALDKGSNASFPLKVLKTFTKFNTTTTTTGKKVAFNTGIGFLFNLQRGLKLNGGAILSQDDIAQLRTYLRDDLKLSDEPVKDKVHPTVEQVKMLFKALYSTDMRTHVSSKHGNELERTQLHFLMLLALYGCNRPGDISLLYDEDGQTLLWSDVRFFAYRPRDNEDVSIGAEVTIRNIKGQRYKPSVFKTCVLYPENTLWACPIRPLLALAFADKIFGSDIQTHKQLIEIARASTQFQLQGDLTFPHADGFSRLPIIRAGSHHKAPPSEDQTTSDAAFDHRESRGICTTSHMVLVAKTLSVRHALEPDPLKHYRSLSRSSDRPDPRWPVHPALPSKRVAVDMQDLIAGRKETDPALSVSGSNVTRLDESFGRLSKAVISEMDSGNPELLAARARLKSMEPSSKGLQEAQIASVLTRNG